ncbi:MAG: two-component system response regulator DevR [Synoicihabitans sp.]
MAVSTPPFTTTQTIVIVDDSPLVRMGLRSVLESAGEPKEFQVCGEFGRVRGTIEMISDLKPDLVLLDIRLPDGHGFDVCRSVTSELPETKVIMLTAFTNDTFVYESITAGAHGYLMKEIEPEKLIQSIRDVLAGQSVLSDLITHKVMRMMRSGGPDEEAALKLLSDQERRVIALVSDGLTNKEIAADMALSENTVKNYLASVFSKLKVKRRSQAAAIWTESRKV